MLAGAPLFAAELLHFLIRLKSEMLFLPHLCDGTRVVIDVQREPGAVMNDKRSNLQSGSLGNLQSLFLSIICIFGAKGAMLIYKLSSKLLTAAY